jgi:hypothetical protein
MNRSRFVCQLQILRKVLKTRFSVSSAGNRVNVSWLILQWTKTLILSVGRTECCDWVSFHPVLLLSVSHVIMTLTKRASSTLIVFCVSHPCHLTSCFIQTDPDPSLASSFSVRNGYGHIPPPVFDDPDFELYCLLGDLTLCEEGAI